MKKFSFEKFELAKFKNLKLIKGGDPVGGDIDTGTNTGNDSSQRCQNPGGNTPVNQNPEPVNGPKKD